MNSPQDCYTEEAGYAYAEGYDEGYKRARAEYFPIYTVHRMWGEYEDAEDVIVFATTNLERAKTMLTEFEDKENKRTEEAKKNDDFYDDAYYVILKLNVNLLNNSSGTYNMEEIVDDSILE